MLKEILQVIELTGYKFNCDKFVQIALVHMLHSSKLVYRNLLNSAKAMPD